MHAYLIILKIRYPKADNVLNFKDHTTDIKNCIDTFNTKFDNKQIEIVDLEEDTISMALYTLERVDRPLKHLSSFSKQLMNEYNFNQYTSIENKLFKCSSFNLDPVKYNENIANAKKIFGINIGNETDSENNKDILLKKLQCILDINEIYEGFYNEEIEFIDTYLNNILKRK